MGSKPSKPPKPAKSVNDSFSQLRLICADTIRPNTDEVRTLVAKTYRQYMLNDALTLAAINRHLNAVRVLLADARTDPTYDKCSALKYASSYGYTETVRAFMEDARIDPGSPTTGAAISSAIKRAAQCGHLSVLDLFLSDARTSPGANQNLALHAALRNERVECARSLLADERVYSRPSALDIVCEWASSSEFINSVLAALSDKACDRVETSRALCRALRIVCCRKGVDARAESVAFILADERIVWCDESRQLFNAALVAACTIGDENLANVRALLADGRADPAWTNNAAFRSTCVLHHIDVMRALLDDPRVDPSDKRNWALSEACRCGFVDLVHVLLDDARVDPSVDVNEILVLTYDAYLESSKNSSKRERFDAIIQILMQDARVEANVLLFSADGRGYGSQYHVRAQREDISRERAFVWCNTAGVRDALTRTVVDESAYQIYLDAMDAYDAWLETLIESTTLLPRALVDIVARAAGPHHETNVHVSVYGHVRGNTVY